MKIAFVAPSCEEIAPFNALLTDLQHSKQAGYDFYDGFYMGEKVSGVLCGIGKVNATIATMLLIEKTRPDLIILGGIMLLGELLSFASALLLSCSPCLASTAENVLCQGCPVGVEKNF